MKPTPLESQKWAGAVDKDVPRYAGKILEGKITGHIVVDVNA